LKITKHERIFLGEGVFFEFEVIIKEHKSVVD